MKSLKQYKPYFHTNLRANTSHFVRRYSTTDNNNQPRDDLIFPDRSKAERPNLALEKDWFQTNQDLNDQRKQVLKKNQLMFVLLEGPPGSGKNDVLARVSKIGYSIIRNTFVEYCKTYAKGDFSKKLDSVGQNRWELTSQFMQSKVRKFKEGSLSVKDNMVFVLRSPISPIVSSKQELDVSQIESQIAALKAEYNVAVVLCKADPIAIHQRVQARSQILGSEEDMAFREVFGETDTEEIERIRERYHALEGAKVYDGVLFTTSTKQAGAGVLRLTGLEFSKSLLS